ncbi:MAG: CocE/NonD family hydrolase [Myxococcota bacterium]|nr:CocE/NonD family hydrolase [Myxococcota bacterium]
MIFGLLRSGLGLPPVRHQAQMELAFVPMRDGVRLATWHFWPVGKSSPAGTLLVRTPYGVRGSRSLIGIAGRLLAEQGYHVILQDVRGRYASEGRFVPFRAERSDGRDTLNWILEQPWWDGRPIGLFGASYLSYTSWFVLAEAPDHVGAIVSWIGSGDLYSVFYRGGAIALQNALEWGLEVGEREPISSRRIDIARGLVHRPVRDADRVALRSTDWIRDWLDHPRHDSYWDAIEADLPEKIPPVLSMAGLYDFFLPSQMAQYDQLVSASEDEAAPRPRLILGPWAHGVPAKIGWWRQGLGGFALREALAHFNAHLPDSGSKLTAASVRYFLPGTEAWQEAENWPPEEADHRRYFLDADAKTGRLSWEEPDAQAPSLEFEHDPDAPTPTIGGALFGFKGGVKDQRGLENRRDVLTYDSPPLESDVTLTGPVRLSLEIAADVEDLDIAAKLIDVTPSGRSENVCEGIQRARWRGLDPENTEPAFLQPGQPTRIQINLGQAVRTFIKGHRIRLVLAGSNFPSFDRNPSSRLWPARAQASDFRVSRRIIYHEEGRRSWLDLCVRASPGKL